MRSLGFGHRSTGTFVSSKTSVLSVNTLTILPSINPVIRRVTLEIRISRGVCALCREEDCTFFILEGPSESWSFPSNVTQTNYTWQGHPFGLYPRVSARVQTAL